jgi:hypothetical protein
MFAQPAPACRGAYVGRKRRGAAPTIAFTYSPRNATIGSVLAARLAGNAEAVSASTSIATAESVSTTGSNGLTPNKKERNRRDAAMAPIKPKTQPTAASFIPEVRMSVSTPDR